MKTVKTIKTTSTKTTPKTATAKTAASEAPAMRASTASADRKRSATVPAPTKAATERGMTPSREKITTELIAARAYIIWEQQGRPHGHDLANWLLAESQLKQEQSFTA